MCIPESQEETKHYNDGRQIMNKDKLEQNNQTLANGQTHVTPQS
jgi:hypothetical protein